MLSPPQSKLSPDVAHFLNNQDEEEQLINSDADQDQGLMMQQHGNKKMSTEQGRQSDDVVLNGEGNPNQGGI